MPRPHHRLNLYLVSKDTDRSPTEEEWELSLQQMVESGAVDERGWAGPRAESLLPGGFQRLRADRPPNRAVFGNRTGGNRVRCPYCVAPLAKTFSRAAEVWRRGGDGAMKCDSCGRSVGLNEVAADPPLAVGRFAVEIRDVNTTELTEEGCTLFQSALGGDFHVIPSRG